MVAAASAARLQHASDLMEHLRYPARLLYRSLRHYRYRFQRFAIQQEDQSPDDRTFLHRYLKMGCNLDHAL